MSYRDDLEAGRRREAALEERLAEQDREIERLRAGTPSASPSEPEPEPAPTPAAADVSRSLFSSLKDLAATISVGFVIIGLPALGIVGPCVCEAHQRIERAEREAAAAKDDALFVKKAQIVWPATIERSEGVFFPPNTTCRVALDIRGDGKARLRGSLAVTCGALALYEQHVDQISCQLEEANDDADANVHRYRVRCLPPEMDDHGTRVMDLDTKIRRGVVVDLERKGHVTLKVDEWSEDRKGVAFVAAL